jgi:peptidoglycan/LPS O-acetylase OafA/YrhL
MIPLVPPQRGRCSSEKRARSVQFQSSGQQSAHVIRGQYFPHIDGIRAIAVLPVVLYHTLAAFCPGGFVGVDVFFFVSGYLITGGILRDIDSGRFTIGNFYHRRIRRIMPAYFAMIAAAFAAGCEFYYAAPLILLGDAAVAATLFLANVYFWLQGGNYFGQGLHTQALLHLWSLSVEEQFYFFVPLLCVILCKIGRRLVAPALALLAAISFAGAVYSVTVGKQYNAFYFLHFRAWELLAGSLLATRAAISGAAGTHPCPHGSPPQAQAKSLLAAQRAAGSCVSGAWRTGQTTLASIGLTILLISYVVISPSAPFPGAAALPPVIGTALLIRYGQNGLVARLLSSRPLVLIGKMSYSLYLWHWPVIVYWKYAVYDQLCLCDYLGMSVLSLILAYCSWRFVEIPVRTSPAWTMGRSFAFAVAGMSFLVAVGTACVHFKGWPSVLHPDANRAAAMPPPRDPFLFARAFAIVRHIGSCTGREFKTIQDHEQSLQHQLSVYLARGNDGRFNLGTPGPPGVVLLGDSHAGSLRYGLDAVLRERKMSGYAISCAGTDMFDMRLPESRSALEKLSGLPSATHVILAQMWRRSLDSEDQAQPTDARLVRLEEFSACIKSMGKILLITTDIPHYRCALADIEARTRIIAPRDWKIVLDSRQQSDSEYGRLQGGINGRLEAICKKTGAVLIPLHLAFKEGDRYGCFKERRGGDIIPLYRDRDHLSMAGSIIAARFLPGYLPESRRAESPSAQRRR